MPDVTRVQYYLYPTRATISKSRNIATVYVKARNNKAIDSKRIVICEEREKGQQTSTGVPGFRVPSPAQFDRIYSRTNIKQVKRGIGCLLGGKRAFQFAKISDYESQNGPPVGP